MKKKLFLVSALFALVAVGAFAQQYNAESDFRVRKEGDGITIIKYTGKATEVNIPPTIQNLPVTRIGDSAFAGGPFGSSLASVTIPESVTSIGRGAFSICQNLTSVTFQGAISTDNFSIYGAFFGDMREKYLAGGIGTYTTTARVNQNSTWTKTSGATPTVTPAIQTAVTSPPVEVQGKTLAEKMDWLKVFAQSNTGYIIEVNANEKGDLRFSDFAGKENTTITLRGIGANRTLDAVSVSNVTLVLDNNITLTVAFATGKGRLIMNAGSTITNAPRGNGVYVSDGGTFIMNGGTISNCSSGGVQLGNGTFTMNGGTISGNKGSGVVVDGRGTFTMNGGTISGNTFNQSLPYSPSGGVRVTNRGTFIMNDGKISGNTSLGEKGGGGVYVGDGGATFTMNGGEISGNTANGGGGVSVSTYVTFTMTGGTISGNTAIADGGGVRVYGTFTMSGGTITGNTVSGDDAVGGGVSVGGTFTKTGGTIIGYASDQRAGNVVKDKSGAVKNFKGHAVYANNKGLLKIREGTAGPGDNMAFNAPTATGAWDN